MPSCGCKPITKSTSNSAIDHHSASPAEHAMQRIFEAFARLFLIAYLRFQILVYKIKHRK